MELEIKSLLDELESFGLENDREQDSELKMKNITKDTGEFLSILLKSNKAKNVLEIGTSNGYSTIWLAQHLIDSDGYVTTIEFDERKVEMAKANFHKAKVNEIITLHHGEAGSFLRQQKDETFDFIFLDSDRSQYMNWWTDLERVLKKGCLMVVDNVISHEKEVETFLKYIQHSTDHDSLVVPVGKGQFLIYKNERI